MLFNNLKNLMERNLRIVLKKDLISVKLKMKRRNGKNKNHNSKDYVNLLRKSLEIKLKKFNLDKDLKIHHVFLLQVNMDGLLTWKES